MEHTVQLDITSLRGIHLDVPIKCAWGMLQSKPCCSAHAINMLKSDMQQQGPSNDALFVLSQSQLELEKRIVTVPLKDTKNMQRRERKSSPPTLECRNGVISGLSRHFDTSPLVGTLIPHGLLQLIPALV